MASISTKTVAHEGTPVRSRLVRIYLLIGLAIAIYWPTASAVFARWTDSDDGTQRHGLLVFAACLWLVFRARARIAAAPAQPWWPALGAVFALSVLWAVAWRAGIQDAHIMLVPALVWSAALAAFGWQVARLLILPFAFFYFAVPAWIGMHEVLQYPTVHAVSLMAKLAGIPNEVDGFLITIPAGVFEVSSGCSGLHYFTVGLALATLLGELEDAKLKRRLGLAVVMASLAILCNWIRVFTIVVAGHLTNMHHSLITEGHYMFGWVLFNIIMGVFMWFSARTERFSVSEPAPARAASIDDTSSLLPLLWAALCMSAVPVATYALDVARPASASPVPEAGPSGRNGWSGPFAASENEWRPVYRGADAQIRSMYVDSSGHMVDRLSVVYRSQRQDAELVNFNNSLLGDGGLESVAEAAIDSPSGVLRETIVRDRNGVQSVIWWVYDIGGRGFVRSIEAQLWYGARSLVRPPVSALVAARASCAPSCEKAREALGNFVRAVPMRAADESVQ